MADNYINSTGLATLRDWVKSLIKNNFSSVNANGTSIGAGSSADTLNISPGSHAKVTGNASTKTITIDADYSDATTGASGLMSAADKTKLNGIAEGATGKQNVLKSVQMTESGGTYKTYTATAEDSNFSIIFTTGNDTSVSRNSNVFTVTIKDTTYSNATTAAAGLMSAADKNKLDAIETGANIGFTAVLAPGGTYIYGETFPELELLPGSNMTIEGDANEGTITFSATDTTYSPATTALAGLMSAADKTKLNGIATGAEVNVQSDWSVTSTASDAYIKNKPTNLNQFTNGPGYQTKSDVATAISNALSSTYKFKGSVASYSNLPTSGNVTGDVWNVEDTGMNYAWTGTAWDSLGSIIDLSAYWAKADLVAFTAAEVTAILNA